MKRSSIWKFAGLAGLAGVAATGVAVARSERHRRSYSPDEVRARLHDRVAAIEGRAEAAADGPKQPENYASGSKAGGPVGVARSAGAPEVLTLDQAIELTRTGDLWLFRGPTVADHAIRTFTNSPVNHVGMSVVLEDLPPLMWHAELGQSVVDVWTGTQHRGVQLHDLRAAVTTWMIRYRQGCWLRQLHADIGNDLEEALLREIARKDGTPFPATLSLVGRWARGRIRRPAPAEVTYCAEVVASSYQTMGLLASKRPPNWYDPGRFWSGDRLELLGGATLGDEIEVLIPGEDRTVAR